MNNRVKHNNLLSRALIYFMLLYPFTSSIITDKLGLSFWSSADEIVILLLIGVLLFENKGRLLFNQSGKKYIGLLFVWCVAGIIPMFTRHVAPNIIFKGLFFQIKNYLLFYFVYSTQWKTKHLEKIYKYLKIIYPIIIMLGIVFYLIPSSRMFDTSDMSSIYNHPGVFATLIIPVGIFAFVMYIEKGNKTNLIVLAVVFICLILAGTIKNIVSITAVCGLYLCYTRKRRKYLFIVIAVVGIIIVFPQLYSLFSVEVIGNILAENAINRPRWMLWQTGFAIMKDFFPIGSGFGTFATSVSFSGNYYSDIYEIYGISNRYGFTREDPCFLQDTYWPAVIGETGITGTICAVLCIYILLKKTFNYIKKDHTESRPFGIVIFLIFAALTVESLFTSTMFGIRSYLGICLLGIYCSIRRSNEVVI